MPEKLRAELTSKAGEYRIPPMLRVYCPKVIGEGPVTCYTFLGTHEGKHRTSGMCTFTCPTWNTKVCGICCQIFSTGDGDAHMCSDVADAHKNVEENEDYVRGKHFQIVSIYLGVPVASSHTGRVYAMPFRSSRPEGAAHPLRRSLWHMST